MSEKEKNIPKKAKLVIEEMRNTGKKTDPQGMYTGRSVKGKYDEPVQDQDDL